MYKIQIFVDVDAESVISTMNSWLESNSMLKVEQIQLPQYGNGRYRGYIIYIKSDKYPNTTNNGKKFRESDIECSKCEIYMCQNGTNNYYCPICGNTKVIIDNNTKINCTIVKNKPNENTPNTGCIRSIVNRIGE